MKLSIITINYNNCQGLRKTIDSVISQTIGDFEWIVIDGGSSDGSKELIEQYSNYLTFWVSEPDKGIYNAMNKGIGVAKGDYLLFLNSGDSLIDEDIIEAFYNLNAGEDIISGDIIIDDSIYNVRFSPDEHEINYRFMCESTILHPASFIRRELFHKYGLYDESLKIVSDWKFFFICLIQYSCSYRKWDRCISSFNTYGISEDPRWSETLKKERERVKSEVLPYVRRTYSNLNKEISDLRKSINMSVGERADRLIKRVLRKLSSIACVNYLKMKRKLSHLGSKSSTCERVIISMTSWKKRIENVPVVVKSILENTVKPDLIVLNLSEEEFPSREADLPSAIRDLVNQEIIRIIWSPGNTRAFKKFIPTLREYPEDVILAIDDDFIYPKDFIESFLSKHKEIPGSPLSGNSFKINGVNGHCGCASLVKADYFGKYIDELLDDEIIQLKMDDIFYVFCAALNGVQYQFVGKLFYTNMKPIGVSEGLSDSNRDKSNDTMKRYMVDRIRQKYNINMEKIHKPYFSL